MNRVNNKVWENETLKRIPSLVKHQVKCYNESVANLSLMRPDLIERRNIDFTDFEA
jgi:hypothetical protein